jgi:NIPSNAP
LAVLDGALAKDPTLLACWYSEIGALNQILILRGANDPAASIAARTKVLAAKDPFGIGEFVTGMSMDTYVAFDFMPPIRGGELGPCYEVRTYVLKTGTLSTTTGLWREAVPGRAKVSTLLAAMTSVTGTVTRFMHIWPYKTLDERARLRAKAVADGVWPPPGGPDQLAAQQTDIYLPASFSPLR